MYQNLYQKEAWTSTRKFFFCFVFLYVTLYVFPFPIDLLLSMLQRFLTWINELTHWKFLLSINDTIDTVIGYWTDFWYWLIPSIAKNILHLKKPITDFPAGSGDTTYNYVEILVKSILAFTGTVVWFLVGKAKRNYTKLYSLLLTILRYYIAWELFMYGFVKVIQTQFPYPRLSRLVEPYGESSPMGLAWSFMGYSYGYNLFTGGCEILGALLLLFRRTKTFGALFTMSVCTTIFIMNLCFDIPVKLFSGHLLLFATFIAADDFHRIIKFFFTNKSVEPYTAPSYFQQHKLRRPLLMFKWFLILFILYTNYTDTMGNYAEYGAGCPKPPLYGIYNITTQITNKDTSILKYNDSTIWKQLIIEYKSSSRVRLMNDSTKRFVFNIDTLKKSIEYYTKKDSLHKQFCTYTYDGSLLKISTKFNNDSIIRIFKRYDEQNFLLNSRGFHWINELPFNR